MQHRGLHFRRKDVSQWFDGLFRYLSEEISIPEMLCRLNWLHEGSLLYQMSQFEKPEGFVGGMGPDRTAHELWEQRVYEEFRAYMGYRHRKEPVPGIWYSLLHDDMENPDFQIVKVRGHRGPMDFEEWTYYSMVGYMADFMVKGDPVHWRLPTAEEAAEGWIVERNQQLQEKKRRIKEEEDKRKLQSGK